MAQTIILTERAQDQIKKWLLTDRYDQTWFLRFEAVPGGCSGMRYHMSLDNNPRTNDKIFKYSGFDLRCDGDSFKYLKQATLDYRSNLWQSSFKIFNPNAASTCCCGKSFLPLEYRDMEAA